MFIPIVSPLGISDDGESLNINADTVASEIAVALKAEKLFLMTDVLGVLNSKGQVLSEVRIGTVESLITAGTIQGGMIPKVRGAVEAIEKGVGSVAIIDGRVQHAVLLEIFTDVGMGTLIHK
jgi:acetylglutamate kinase